MKLLGVVMIVQGILSALTIVGIVICWLPIWLGVLLFKAAGAAEAAQLTGDRMQLEESLRKIKTYFVINGVLMLIMLVLAGIGLIMAGGTMLALLDSCG
ncbi:MAG: hypothetical protein KAU35_02600 [candidate division Zixibacteria bacterium]|nr:hypothetical protein [candidate division Zixibacteria bacterium]